MRLRISLVRRELGAARSTFHATALSDMAPPSSPAMWINELDSPEVIRRRVRQSLADLPLRSRCNASVNFSVKVLDFVQPLGGFLPPFRKTPPLSINRFRRVSPFARTKISCPHSGGLSPESSRNRRNACVLICELMTPAQARKMLFAVCPRVYAGTVPVLRNPCPVPFRVQQLHPYGPMPCLGRKLASCRLVLGVSARPGALPVKTLLQFTGAAQFTMHLGLTVP